MAKKDEKGAKLTKQQLLEWYMQDVLTGERKSTVFAFAKDHGIEEQEFYQFFGSFDAIDQSFFSEITASTLDLVQSAKGYQKMDARTRLLTFYYTFFENLTANRSFAKYVLTKHSIPLKNLSALQEMRGRFFNFIDSLPLDEFDLQHEGLKKTQKRAIEEAAWLQLLMTLKFWLDDQSALFEKTDIFIEKAVNTSFDLLDVKPVKSLLDFGKFVFQERSPFRSKSTTS